MAVPKKKTSKSRRDRRRAASYYSRFKIPNVVTDENGDHHLAHHMSPEGFYKGRKIIEEKEKKSSLKKDE